MYIFNKTDYQNPEETVSTVLSHLFGDNQGLAIQGSPDSRELNVSEKVQKTGILSRFSSPEKQGLTLIFTNNQKKYRFFCFSPKRSNKRIREVFRGRMESPVPSPLLRAFPLRGGQNGTDR